MELPNFPRDPVGSGSTPCFPLGCQVGWTVGRLKRWLIRWMVDWLDGRLDSGLISKLLWAQKELVFFLHRSPRFLTVKNVFPLLLTVDAAADSLENWPLLVFKMSFLLKFSCLWLRLRAAAVSAAAGTKCVGTPLRDVAAAAAAEAAAAASSSSPEYGVDENHWWSI